MLFRRKRNLILGGGGIKGIAYAGVQEAAERNRIVWGNIAGVSAGALAGSFLAAGYNSKDMWNTLEDFDFKQLNLSRNKECMSYLNKYQDLAKSGDKPGVDELRDELKRGINLFSSQKNLFDGDYLEEWVYRCLKRKGIVTFGDLRGDIKDETNPKGYRLRATGVDITRWKLVTLPDDIACYGYDPDRFEVAKAVRISTSVPFAFKPVQLKKQEGDKVHTFDLVDGGVFDSFPHWAVSDNSLSKVGFKLVGQPDTTSVLIESAVSVFKFLIGIFQDIGVPPVSKHDMRYVADIDTRNVQFLDFNLSTDEKEYLYNSGRRTAKLLFNRMN